MPRKKILDLSVDWLSILDYEGNADKILEPALDNETLEKFYRTMVITRLFDDKALKLQRQGRMLTFGSCLGQEASQIGSAFAMKSDDWFFPAFREHGVQIARGIPMKLLYIYWMGSEDANLMLPHRNFTVAIPVSTQVLHAVGAALAAKIQKQNIASVVYFGDGATSEGDFHEGMNFAGVFKTPTVFVCQNNQYAISLPREKQTASKTLAQKALAYGFEGIQVDGNDVLAVYSATEAALLKAKSGGGPTLIECFTYRLGAHTTSDDPTRYRKKEEEEEWRKKDPIKRFRTYLEKKGIWNQSYEDKLLKEASEEIEKAVEEAEAYSPVVENMFKYVYAEITPDLKEQMDELLGFIAKRKR
ncbi:MAG: pyruvate dehydrogenase (acetyl-transferring) E1 component subunit alpha [Candidatus Methanoperedens sp.]|nr:pyruvate dehydrogenase (acetyl-transferring) E1 component subunit alpha [Candidatus Methanoperedens sp.]MCE8429003.1 pyruvate dehydrogenase (acetyl-transferring) E1 component subunit alpha [Candidatus Methanoperedens sp.]